MIPYQYYTLFKYCYHFGHSGIAPKFHTLSPDLSIRGAVNLIPFFHIFAVFATLNAIRALRAGWRKRHPFYAFLCTSMMYRPQWDIPPRVAHVQTHTQTDKHKHAHTYAHLSFVFTSYTGYMYDCVCVYCVI